ncbi:hypothetical protein MTR_4g046013 [Medicago truncatula]|uniref:Uncharacterized protein n=1 Tax=Medicago truncatula TaxID=3880 RepID=A0A072UIU9_MEDTR|nr:hypothetical protein MTR_4g046013 [Medicago truncatula]
MLVTCKLPTYRGNISKQKGASNPQCKSINILTGHQALNIKSKSSQGIKPSTCRANAHRASNPQLK